MNYHNHNRIRMSNERDAEIEAFTNHFLGDTLDRRRERFVAAITILVAKRVGEERERFKSSCRIHTAWTIGRYLMNNAEGRLDGAEKAERHRDLVLFYLAVIYGGDPDHAGRDNPQAYELLHEATQELTGHLDEVIGFPIHGMPDYDDLEPKFFERFHEIAITALAAIRKETTDE